MNKYVSYKQLSNKAKKQVDAKARRTFNDFGCLAPVTKIVKDKKKEKNRRFCREKTD